METPAQTPQQQSKKPLAAIAAVVILVIGAVVVFASGIFKTNGSNSKVTQNTQDNQQKNQQDNNQVVVDNKKYKDGVYTITGSYRSPGGQEHFGLSITLKDDVISDATFTPEPVSGIGQMKQTAFNQGFKDQVVGKKIDDVSLTVVNGASLTTAGFMSALESLKQQAIIS